MFSKDTEALLHKSLNNRSLALPRIVYLKNLHNDIDDLVALEFDRLKLAVVADANTEHALGADVFRALKSRFSAQFIFLEGEPEASEANVELVRARSAKCDALVAVGSGTINDICKYAAFKDGKPYVVFPTAASMNGYLSANASISMGGFKKTLKAAMPKAVYCDLGVLTKAPVRLSKSGFGDSLARTTAQADWLLSHYMIGTEYDETPFTLLESIEPELLDGARGIATASPASMQALIHTLLLSGLGMTIAGGSYPASQGEHMIAHAYEMLRKPAPVGKPAPTLHGEEIGVTTLYMSELQHRLLRQPPSPMASAFPEREIIEAFGDSVAQEAKQAYQEKNNHAEKSAQLWDTVVTRVSGVLLTPAKIEVYLDLAEAPKTIESLGWKKDLFGNALKYSKFMRNRFTFLDLVYK